MHRHYSYHHRHDLNLPKDSHWSHDLLFLLAITLRQATAPWPSKACPLQLDAPQGNGVLHWYKLLVACLSRVPDSRSRTSSLLLLRNRLWVFITQLSRAKRARKKEGETKERGGGRKRRGGEPCLWAIVSQCSMVKKNRCAYMFVCHIFV